MEELRGEPASGEVENDGGGDAGGGPDDVHGDGDGGLPATIPEYDAITAVFDRRQRRYLPVARFHARWKTSLVLVWDVFMCGLGR